MKKIGMEEHYNPEALAKHLSRTADGAVVLRYGAGRFDIEQRFLDMDEAGVDMQVLSVGVMGLCDLPPAEGTAMSKDMNNEIAEVVQQYPDKFAGLAAIAAQDPEPAADELERAVTKLGLKGVMINSHVQGEYLDEMKFRVLLERAAELKAPLYIHPNKPSPDMIKPYQKYPILEGACWGFAAETGLHAMRLICSGVFDQLPDLKIILGHMGESLPFWLWRMDNIWQRGGIDSGFKKTKKLPSEYIKENFYVTTSGMSWPTVIQFVCQALGAERVMFGVDYPLESSILAVQAVENTPIGDDDKERVFHLNAAELLRL